MDRAVPLGIFWFFYLGGLGIFFPYYSLYLRENAGLTGTQVGMVLAMLPLTGIAAQPFWGQVADLTGSRARVLALLAFGAAAGQLLLDRADDFPALIVATGLLAACSTAVIPMAVSVTLAVLGDRGSAVFGRVRVWGTIGFLVLVVGFPRLLAILHPAAPGAGGIAAPGLGVMFAATATMWALAGLTALAIPREGAVAARAPRGDWRRLVRHPPFVRVLSFALAAYLCLHGPITMFPIYVRAHGGDLDTVSRMWIMMLLLEIPLLVYTGTGVRRLGPRGLLAIGVLAGGVRWVGCGVGASLTTIYVLSILHGVVVVGLLVGAPLYVEAAVPERLRSTGQALLAMVGIGFGGIASNLVCGVLLETLGPDAPYLAGGIGALLLAAVLPLVLPEPVRPREGAV